MKKLILTINLLLLTVVFIYAQQTVIIDDDFNNNTNSWYVHDDADIKTQITGGHYVMQNKITDSGYRFWNTFDFDENNDFYIEVKMKQTAGAENEGYGIMFGADGMSNNYNFEVSSNGYYRICYQTSGAYSYQVEWTENSSINGFDIYNVLKIEKKGTSIYYYINGKAVFSSVYYQAYGTDIGFVLRNGVTAKADYYKFIEEAPQINVVEDALQGVVKENLGLSINSPYCEIIPLPSADGRYLYVTRHGHPDNVSDDKDHDDVYVADLFADGSWSKLKNLGEPINNDAHNFVISISPDNNTMLLNALYSYTGESRGGNGISITHRQKDGSWSVPTEVVIDNFFNNDAYQNFCVTPNGKAIIMAIEHDITYGGSDLYISFRQNDGTYSAPQNMGAAINTPEDEGTPFMAADGVSLYFNSEGHAGYGNADIFVAKRLDETWLNWGEPKNLGPEVNTENWDAYFTLDAKGDYAYMVSTKNSYGEEDIFRFKLLSEEAKPEPVVILSGIVYDKKTNFVLGADISYEDLMLNKEMGIARSNPGTGEYKIVLPYGKKYGIIGKKKGYMPESKNIDLTKIDEYTEIDMDLYLAPIEEGKVILLNNIFFDAGKAILKEESFAELDRLIALMTDNPTMIIELHGHTNKLGNEDALKELSENRVGSVKVYLIEKGISGTRIREKGFGSTKPVADNETLEGRKKNQRVEFKIIKK